MKILCAMLLDDKTDDYSAVGTEISEFFDQAEGAKPMTLSHALQRAIDAIPPARFHTLRVIRVSGLTETEMVRVNLHNGAATSAPCYASGFSHNDEVTEWHSAGCMPDEFPGCVEINVLMR